ncbi:hypothetical protein J2W46_006910 [Paraburkholderia strydomiana]|nr:hypothetical protein [Paraburkholderia strydomiana]
MQDKIARLREQMRNLDQIKEQLKTQPDGQLSMTDPDARPVATSGKCSGMVGYNVQVAVDAKHHFIVPHGVNNSGSDRAQLSPMTKTAREAMGKARPRTVADCGYCTGTRIKECPDAGIGVMRSKPATSSAKHHGRFDRSDFVYIARDEKYNCAAGQRAIYRFTGGNHGIQLRRY